MASDSVGGVSRRAKPKPLPLSEAEEADRKRLGGVTRRGRPQLTVAEYRELRRLMVRRELLSERRAYLVATYGGRYAERSGLRKGRCAYCGVQAKGQDHVPSLWALDMMSEADRQAVRCELVPSCWECNQALGRDGGVSLSARAGWLFPRLLAAAEDAAYGARPSLQRSLRRALHAAAVAWGPGELVCEVPPGEAAFAGVALWAPSWGEACFWPQFGRRFFGNGVYRTPVL